MSDPQLQLLLDQLKSVDAPVRDQATQELWDRWFQQKGMYGYQLLRQSQLLIDGNTLDRAETLLTDIIRDQPDFVEAWNRRAILFFRQRRYREALADCEQVIQRAAYHFGALHGQGLCYMALGEWSAAIAAFRQALRIQPYSLENQRLLLECMAKIS